MVASRKFASSRLSLLLRPFPVRNTRSQAQTLDFGCVIPYRMKAEERERMYELCALIEKEKDHIRFQQLINELNELLERREQQLGDKPRS
jgi:hypothetical protein